MSFVLCTYMNVFIGHHLIILIIIYLYLDLDFLEFKPQHSEEKWHLSSPFYINQPQSIQIILRLYYQFPLEFRQIQFYHSRRLKNFYNLHLHVHLNVHFLVKFFNFFTTFPYETIIILILVTHYLFLSVVYRKINVSLYFKIKRLCYSKV